MNDLITESKQCRLNGLWLTAAFVGLTLLLTLTHWPQEKMPFDTNRFGLDKIAHMAIYAGLAGLFFKAVAPGRTFLAWLGIIAGLVLVTLLDEITQPWFNRQFDLLDLAADVVGIVGCFIIMYSRHQRNGTPQKTKVAPPQTQ